MGIKGICNLGYCRLAQHGMCTSTFVLVRCLTCSAILVMFLKLSASYGCSNNVIRLLLIDVGDGDNKTGIILYSFILHKVTTGSKEIDHAQIKIMIR
jgi:hypothetical protein